MSRDHAHRPGESDADSFHSQSLNGGTDSTLNADIWSEAYREAVESLGKEMDVAILMGNNATQLLMKLEDMDKEAYRKSAFLRGVAYLRSIQVPLERFKLALDLASPLSSLDPTASTVFGVVRGVTAVSVIDSFHTGKLRNILLMF